jgi:hypothetical protein
MRLKGSASAISPTNGRTGPGGRGRAVVPQFARTPLESLRLESLGGAGGALLGTVASAGCRSDTLDLVARSSRRIAERRSVFRVGVGTAVTRRPLHRSGRAALPHPAPTSGDDVEAKCTLTYPTQLMMHSALALSPDCAALAQVPLGQAPSLHPLRRRSPGLVRELHRCYGPVRLPRTVHHRRASLDFPMRPVAFTGGPWLSRFSCEVLRCVHGVSDRAGLLGVLRSRHLGCGLPLPSTASASRSLGLFAAQYPARTSPCQRFAPALADGRA